MVHAGMNSSHNEQRTPNRRSRINQVSMVKPQEEEEESSSDEEYVFILGHETGKTRVPETTVEVNGVPMKL